MATISSLLREHVTLQLRSVDRIFLHAYVPRLQTMGLMIRFLLDRGYPIPSPAALGRIGRGLVTEIERFAADNQIPVVRFGKRDSKEVIAAPYLARAAEQGREGVVMIGVAQEKSSAWRSWKTGGSKEHPHFEFGRQSVFVNHYYFYLWDAQFGPAFFKLLPYAPYDVWIWCNGHEWAKRQAQHTGIGFAALDNGFASTEDPAALQRICDRLGAGAIGGFCHKWLRLLPSALTAEDRSRGVWYDLAFRQIEFSDTRVFDRPAAGRAWFEATIREHLDLGRPDRVSLIFDRRVLPSTRGPFATRVITRGVDPSIQIHYRASKCKQYSKEGKALRTETTINDTRDFGIRRRVRAANFQALRRVGNAVNRRLLELEVAGEACAPDADTLTRVVLPSITDGLPVPALRFGDPRVVALLAGVAASVHTWDGFTNNSLRSLVQAHLGQPYSARQMTYDLRRLRRKGFIQRIDGTHRYRLTADGRRLAVFFTKLYTRIVTPALAQLDPTVPPHVGRRSALGRAWHNLEEALNALVASSGIAA